MDDKINKIPEENAPELNPTELEETAPAHEDLPVSGEAEASASGAESELTQAESSAREGADAAVPDEQSSEGNPKKKRAQYARMSYPRRIAILVCLAVLVVSGYNLVKSLLEYKQGDDAYTDLASEFLSTPEPTVDAATPTPTPATTPIVHVDDVPPLESGEPETSFIQDYAPDVWPNVDFEGLTEKNADTTVWIICVGTNINYPVVHSKDNKDYLTKMFDGRTSKLGAIFVDARNRKGFVDRNTIIYGHNMRNHSMFWTLTQYRSQSFFNNHPTMRLIRPEGRYEIQLFAGTVAKDDEYDCWKLRFEGDDDFLEWVQSMRDRSSFSSSVTVEAGDHIVSLSTCSYEHSGGHGRYVLYGKLVALDGQGIPQGKNNDKPSGGGAAASVNPTKPQDANTDAAPEPVDSPEPTDGNAVSDAILDALDRIRNAGQGTTEDNPLPAPEE